MVKKKKNTVASYVAENDIDAAPLAPINEDSGDDKRNGIILVPEDDGKDDQNNSASSQHKSSVVVATTLALFFVLAIIPFKNHNSNGTLSLPSLPTT